MYFPTGTNLQIVNLFYMCYIPTITIMKYCNQMSHVNIVITFVYFFGKILWVPNTNDESRTHLNELHVSLLPAAVQMYMLKFSTHSW
jgi:hypothetical protein